MSTYMPSRVAGPRAPARNVDYQWADFDSEAYFQHNYGEPHPDDDLIIRYAVEVIKRAPPIGAELNVIDVGTGPNLIPFLCALPRAAQLTAWEYAESNVAWLQAELRRGEVRPQWRHFWDVAVKAYGPEWRLPDDPKSLLQEKCVIRQGSIFDLPERLWDAATMFFCAESITERQEEFEAACTAYAHCVKVGGVLTAVFTVRCSGYEVGDSSFPVLELSAELIESTFARLANNVRAERISIGQEKIETDYRYSDFILLTGTAD